MTKIFNFPTCPISKQLFHVPGGAIEGGYTSGAVRLISPEPGGRSVLELQIAFQVREWDFPISSWLMSKGNGEVFRVRLAPTPQILGARSVVGAPWDNEVLWSNARPWSGDITTSFAAVALEGTTTLVVNMEGYGDIVHPGHLIGHTDNAYIIDEVDYDTVANTATLTVKPPIRRDVAVDDTAYFRPFFIGTIANISDVRATYDSENVGNIQPGKIIFSEAIV